MSTDRFGAAILIVDDQLANVRLLEHTLRRAGYVRTTSTMDPCDVCALHLANRYDLIILDLQMPIMNGFEVLEALKNCEERPAVLVMSADPSQLVLSLEAGATSFLSKPFVLADVLLQVKGLLDTAIRDVEPVASTVALTESLPIVCEAVPTNERRLRSLLLRSRPGDSGGLP
jgi:adenylate cyclase